jgi:hypothetical protein
MAPIPADNSLSAEPDHKSKSHSGYWSKANIALTTVFVIVFLAVVLAGILFCLHRRKEKKKLDNRRSDKTGLLQNEDKTNMFSRNRATSLTLYVDSETDARTKRSSADTMPLVPLQITPAEEARDPMANNNTTESEGTGVSALSRQSNATLSTMMLSPVSSTAGDGDLSVRPAGRARSTSTASQKARYYESTPLYAAMPPIPKIVHTASP